MELLPTQEPDLGVAEQKRDYSQAPKAGAVLYFSHPGSNSIGKYSTWEVIKHNYEKTKKCCRGWTLLTLWASVQGPGWLRSWLGNSGSYLLTEQPEADWSQQAPAFAQRHLLGSVCVPRGSLPVKWLSFRWERHDVVVLATTWAPPAEHPGNQAWKNTGCPDTGHFSVGWLWSVFIQRRKEVFPETKQFLMTVMKKEYVCFVSCPENVEWKMHSF